MSTRFVGMTLLLVAIAFLGGGSVAYADEAGSCCEVKQTTATPVAQQHGPGHGQGQAGQPAQAMRGARNVMQGAHALVFNHEKIVRHTEDIPGGVRTTTTTEDPGLLAVLQKHPGEMYSHLDKGGQVRRWDPLFNELGKFADQIHATITPIENGVIVESTSENPEVVKLIRAHALKVNEFVARGRAAMREATPLPEGYTSAAAHSSEVPAECCMAEGATATQTVAAQQATSECCMETAKADAAPAKVAEKEDCCMVEGAAEATVAKKETESCCTP